ncbi:MAG: hypothetical protein N2C14_30560 [Planctomycetales bacterium]
MRSWLSCRVALTCVALICCGLIYGGQTCATALGEEDSPPEVERLKRQVAELEEENRALRQSLQHIRDALRNAELAAGDARSKKLNLVITPGGWGSSQADVKAVCLSAASDLWKQFPDRKLHPIHIRYSTEGPMVEYRRGPAGEYRVLLNTKDQAWAQLAYQFAHEFCHVNCNYRKVPNPQLWFEETLCETASLFALRRMAETWKTNPPYSNWKSYSNALNDYADKRIDQAKVPEDQTFLEWFKQHREDFRRSAVRRDLNSIVAGRILPLLEKDPSHWEATRYLNLGDQRANATFELYLNDWWERSPEKHKKFIAELADLFGVPLIKDGR